MSVRPLVLPVCLLFATAACSGGGSPTAPATPNPTPTPAATPTPSPSPSACPDGSCGNTRPVVRANLVLYLMFNDKRDPVPAPDPEKQIVKEPIPVGYTVRLDVTGRDADNRETDGDGRIEWFYSDAGLVKIDRRSPWTHDFTVLKPGPWSVYVVFDGVSSNSLNFTFVDKK